MWLIIRKKAKLINVLTFILSIAFLCLAFSKNSAVAKDMITPLEVSEIAPGVFVAYGSIELVNRENQGHIANLGFIIGDESVAVIDSGGSLAIGQKLLAAIKNKTNLPISHVINTHAHPDHIFGNAAFIEGDEGDIEFVGHSRFNGALTSRGPHYLESNLELIGKKAFLGSILVSASKSIESEEIIDLGNRRLKLTAYPTAHTDNDLIVHDEKTNTAFLGDLLFVDHAPAIDGSLKGWLAVMEQLSERPFARVVPGHGEVIGKWPEAMAPQQRYLNVLVKELRTHISKGTSINEASRKTGHSERDHWKLFDEFNTRNATAGFAELEWE